MTNKKFIKLIRNYDKNDINSIVPLIRKIFENNKVPKGKIIKKITGSKNNFELLEENLDEIIENITKIDVDNLADEYDKKELFLIYIDVFLVVIQI